MASLMVAEYGGKQLGTSAGYELVSDGEDEGDNKAGNHGAAAGGTMQLGALHGGPPPPALGLGGGGGDLASEKQQLQLALAAQLLDKERRKKEKKSKKGKKEKKEKKVSVRVS